MKVSFQEQRSAATVPATLSVAWHFDIVPIRALETHVTHHWLPQVAGIMHAFELSFTNATAQNIEIAQLAQSASEGFEVAKETALAAEEAKIGPGEVAVTVAAYRASDIQSTAKEAGQAIVHFSFAGSPSEKFLIKVTLFAPPEKQLALGIAAQDVAALVFTAGRLQEAGYIIFNKSPVDRRVRVERNTRETGCAVIHRMIWDDGQCADTPREIRAGGREMLRCVVYPRLTGFFPFDLLKLYVYDGKVFLPAELGPFTIEIKAARVEEVLRA